MNIGQQLHGFPQLPQSLAFGWGLAAATRGAMLDNNSVQAAPSAGVLVAEGELRVLLEVGRRLAAASPQARLQLLKSQKFAAEGRGERIARSLAALENVERLELADEDLRWITENISIEDEQ